MNRVEACKLLNIIPEQLDEKILKKMYRKSCLRHHPDKKGDTTKFIKITAAYEFLLMELNSKDHVSWLDGLDIELLRKYATVLEKLKIPWFDTYILYPLKVHLSQYEFIELNPTLNQLFNKEVYYLETVHSYIPLWHQEVTIKKTTVYINPILPSNIELDENNNVIVKLCCYQPSILLGGISFLIQDNPKIVFKRRGIPRIQIKIYDSNDISDVIIFTSSPPSS